MVDKSKSEAEELFCRKEWEAAAAIFSEYLNRAAEDRHALGRLGTCLLRLSRYEDFLEIFEKMRQPPSIRETIDWAALLINRGCTSEALSVLSPLPMRPGKASRDELFDYVSCVLFKDILQYHLIGQENSRPNEFIPEELFPRNRLLRSANLVLRPTILLFERLGRLLGRPGRGDKATMLDFSKSMSDLCWVYGVPGYPGPSEERRPLAEMAGFRQSTEVYRRVFLSYLAYWIETGQEVRDLLIASQKPGDAHALYSFIRSEEPENVLEIGTFVGFSTSLIAGAMADRTNACVHCIDPGISHLTTVDPLFHAQHMFNRLGFDHMIRIHKGFFSHPRENGLSQSPTLGPEASSWLPPIDIALIDGDHATTALLQDIMLVLPCLRSQAKLLIHDIRSWRSVRQAVMILLDDDLFRKQMRYWEFTPLGIDGFAVLEVNR